MILLCLDVPHAQAAPTPPDDVRAALHYAAGEWGVSEAKMTQVAWCESRYRADAVSPGGHLGILQHSRRYWPRRVEAFNRYARAHGLPTMLGHWNAPIDNARVAGWMVAGGGWGPWACA